MVEQFKVCGNCGHCAMVAGEFVCVDPTRPQQEVVPMGVRRSCFVVTALTPEQAAAAILAPEPSVAIN